MRKEFEMSEVQYAKLLDACKPTRLMYLSGGTPMGGDQQSNANMAWELLGEEMGFEFKTVRPSEKGDRFFTAEVKEARAVRASDFHEGRKVIYIPNHVRALHNADRTHKDVEKGVVTGSNDASRIVFVRFGADVNAKACYPEDLEYDVPAAKAEKPNAPAPTATTGPATATAPSPVQGGTQANKPPG